MLEIDGSLKSGSGTIVRDTLAFCALKGEAVHLTHVRAKRDRPGLRPQHLKAVEAVAELSGGRLTGAGVGAREVRFEPGETVASGRRAWDIGTAGSTTMVAMTLLPLALFAGGPSRYEIEGGLFQDFAPSIFHVQQVLLPILRRMGAEMDARILRPGYVPRGKGKIEIEVAPVQGKLRPITLPASGKVLHVRGTALSSLLEERRVSDRMADECGRALAARGYPYQANVLYDTREHPVFESPSVQPGACLAVWASTDTGNLIGADMAGARGRTSERIGREVARQLLQDLDSGASVDRHLADQLIPFAALAEGESRYLVPAVTEHVETRLWLIEEIFGARWEMRAQELVIHGIGYERSR